MNETEIRLADIMLCALRKWRRIVVFALICAMVTGAFTAVRYVRQMHDEEMLEKWQTEYEIQSGVYWAAINDYDRQISENERLSALAQSSLEALERQEAEYLSQIADLEASIAYYEALIEDYRDDIVRLNAEKESLYYYLSYYREQNENSLYMKIDPYHVQTYEAYLRIDTGYEIMPGSTYQNIDRTDEVINFYQQHCRRSDFYEGIIEALSLDTEVRYLTNMIYISVPTTGTLRVTVNSDSETWSQQVGAYIVQAIMGNHNNAEQTVCKHTLTAYNVHSYETVDLSVHATQKAALDTVKGYEDSIRGVETSVLELEADIREINTEIRGFRSEIDALYDDIDLIPLSRQAYEDEIAQYTDANYTLRSEQLALKTDSAPVYPGYTAARVALKTLEAIAIAAVVGALICVAFFALANILGGKVLSSEQVCLATGAASFGVWFTGSRRWFASVDRQIARLGGIAKRGTTLKSAQELVLSNICVACAGHKKLLICGGADADTICAIATATRERLPALCVLSGGTVGFDANVVRAIAECDAIILVEQVDRSGLNDIQQISARAQSLNKPIAGVIVVP